jgi:hypothetical protein
VNAAQAKDFATRYLEAANSHSVDRIMAFYAPDGELESRLVVNLMGEPSGKIKGWDVLHDYFTKFVSKYSYMSLQLIESAWGLGSITIWFANQIGGRTSMYLELDSSGKITRNVVHYND